MNFDHGSTHSNISGPLHGLSIRWYKVRDIHTHTHTPLAPGEVVYKKGTRGTGYNKRIRGT